jgi:hypothetical protein
MKNERVAVSDIGAKCRHDARLPQTAANLGTRIPVRDMGSRTSPGNVGNRP